MSIPQIPVIVDADTGKALANSWVDFALDTKKHFYSARKPCCFDNVSTAALLSQLCCGCSGGGNVLNVQRTIRQFIAAGAKGCTLEDQKWPKKSGHIRGKEVIGMDEMISKVAGTADITCCGNMMSFTNRSIMW